MVSHHCISSNNLQYRYLEVYKIPFEQAEICSVFYTRVTSYSSAFLPIVSARARCLRSIHLHPYPLSALARGSNFPTFCKTSLCGNGTRLNLRTGSLIYWRRTESHYVKISIYTSSLLCDVRRIIYKTQDLPRLLYCSSS